MQKLLERFTNNPTVENARKVRDYSNKHPMASCLLSPLQIGVLNHAIVVAKG